MLKYKKVLSLIMTAVMFLSMLPISYAVSIAFIDNPDAIEDSSYSVVMLFCYDVKGELYATGSGFAAFDDGVIVTNYHVISGAVDSIVAYTEGGMYFDIDETLAVDETNDIAILKTSAKTRMTLLPIGSAKEMKKGSKVVAIGSPQGMVNSVSSGLLTGYVNFDGVQLLQFDAAISEGSSGGALFNNSGEVIGITSSALIGGNDLNFAVPIEYAIELWNKYNQGEFENIVTAVDKKDYKEFIDQAVNDGKTYESIINMISESFKLSQSEYKSAINYIRDSFYEKAVEMYRNGREYDSKTYFEKINPYKEAEKYIFLIQFHSGNGYDEEQSIKYNYWPDVNYERLILNIEFEDAKQIIISHYFYTFLEGVWKTNDSNYEIKCEIKDGNAYLETNLIENDWESYNPINGKYYGLNKNEKTELLNFTIIHNQCIKVEVCEKGNTYKLYKVN